MLVDLLQTLINGVAIGGVYLLFGIGLTLIFGVIQVINFAHGAFMMVAMYVAIFLFRRLGLDPYLSLFVTAPLLFAIGYAMQRLLINPVLHHPHLNQLLLTMGVLLVVENGMLWLVGPTPETVRVPYVFRAIEIGDLFLSLPRFLSLALALAIALGLWAFLGYARIGRAVRAAAQDHKGALLVGIDVDRVYALAFGIGCACVGAAGSLIVPFYQATPYVGHSFLIMGFVVVIVGGLGSLRGAVIAGLLVGVVDSLGQAYLPGTSGRMLIFVGLILVLLLRPQGLFVAAGR